MKNRALRVDIVNALTLFAAVQEVERQHQEIDRPHLFRGIALVLTNSVSLKDGIWLVQSQRDARKRYAVDLERNSCTCDDAEHRGAFCKHRVAASLAQCQRDLFDALNRRQKAALLGIA